MKLILENWREYTENLEPINTLESGRRFINDLLVEVEQDKYKLSTTGISGEEFNQIKKWAGLTGGPDFLGKGSKGNAYGFGDKVLKITSDYSEVAACAALVGKSHPNVYKIYKVALYLPIKFFFL